MLVSTKHQNESATGIPMSPPSWTSLLPLSPSYPSKVVIEPMFEFPESYSKFPLALYFTYGNVCFHVTLFLPLLPPPPPPPPPCLCSSDRVPGCWELMSDERTVCKVLLYTAPAFVVLMSAVLFKEQITISRIINTILTKRV